MANRSLKPGQKTIDNRADIVWEGAFLSRHSLSLVNRELAMTLNATKPDWNLRIRPHASDDLTLEPGLAHPFVNSRLVDAPDNSRVWIRHHWPPNWNKPNAARFVVVQPWEFGSIPVKWVDGLKCVDELWVPSNYVRDCYIQSGVPAEKVAVVPNGVNTARFYPDVSRASVPTTKSFKFLFVGGTISRKGIDVL